VSKADISSAEVVRELVAYFGVRRAAALLGYCFLFVVAGAESRRDILAADVGSIELRYRILSDIRRFRASLAEKGYAMELDEHVGEYEMVRRLAEVRRAA
jgi:predicted LPLAT superfamily acyltransferase